MDILAPVAKTLLQMLIIVAIGYAFGAAATTAALFLEKLCS